jgi:predicted RNA-binding Zn-ribbon protein involved in translation (DUF1610 family)
MTLQHSEFPAWQPPRGYEPVASAVEGITVFAPRAEELTRSDAPVTFKCPRCGATTHFDVATGGLICEHCGYTAPVRAERVGQQAPGREFTLETLKQAEQGWGIGRWELYCQSCGASLAIPEAALATTCPFCASNQVNVRAASADHLRPQCLILFKVAPEALPARVSEWLGKGWLHPGELASAVMDRFVGVYLSFWMLGADVTADWKARVGREKETTYYDEDTHSERTGTVVEWSMEGGQVRLSVDDVLVMGGKRVSQVIFERINRFNLSELVAYAPEYLAGWQAQAYDVNLPEALEEGRVMLRERAGLACLQDTKSSMVADFTMTADIAGEVWRYVLLPVYIAAYKYEGKVYQVIVNGQTGAVAGQKPVAWWKVWLGMIASLAPGLAVGLLGLLILIMNLVIGLALLIIGGALLTIGGKEAVTLYREAVGVEAA